MEHIRNNVPWLKFKGVVLNEEEEEEESFLVRIRVKSCYNL